MDASGKFASPRPRPWREDVIFDLLLTRFPFE